MSVGHDERSSELESDRRAVRQAGRKRDWSEEPRGAVCGELQGRRLGV